MNSSNSSITQALLTEKELSALLKVSVASLRRWRMLGRPPAFCKLAGAVRYDWTDVAEFLQDGKRN
jgi:predicted site-specific integrase-resolvase